MTDFLQMTLHKGPSDNGIVFYYEKMEFVTNSITCYCDNHAISLQLSYPVRSFLVKSTNFQEIKKGDVSENFYQLANGISKQLCKKTKLKGKRTCYICL